MINVLLVEDTKMGRDCIAGYLQSRRFERIGAGSASEGAESWFYSRYIDNGPSPCS